MVRRMLRTVGRTALISGTATAVAGRVAHHQRQKLAKTHVPPPQTSLAPEPSHAHNDIAESLERLARLKTSGALSEKEFKAAKEKLLS
jgi:hypothetical protein